MVTQTESRKTSKGLPDPAARPDTDVVIYDGHCRICTGGVKILYRLDVQKRLSFLSLHDARVADVAPNLTFDQMMEEMWVADIRGRQHSGAEAFRYLTRRLVLLWPVMPLMHIPGSLPVWKWMYRKVAAARYRFGKHTGEDCGDACQIHFGRKPDQQNSK
ncbi:DUF393 domain-containing protein [Bremerella sp. JC817]|uniref:thiol-disulfide oxidoreductase DCC family protein n=1 Tax=Bremerella sp. JC817 TaxID=3231756 RepID=UPI00345A98E4